MRRKLIFVPAVISVFIIILCSTFFSFLYNISYYEREYQKLGVYETFTKEEAKKAANNIFDFFRSKDELDRLFFKEDEISHLNDVRTLIVNAYSFYLVSLVIFWAVLILYYYFSRKRFIAFFADMMFLSGIFCTAILVLSALLFFLAGFDWLFLRFHELFFTGNYAFDPSVSNMKALFPDRFFFDFMKNVVIVTFIKGLLLTATGYFLKKNNAKF